MGWKRSKSVGTGLGVSRYLDRLSFSVYLHSPLHLLHRIGLVCVIINLFTLVFINKGHTCSICHLWLSLRQCPTCSDLKQVIRLLDGVDWLPVKSLGAQFPNINICTSRIWISSSTMWWFTFPAGIEAPNFLSSLWVSLFPTFKASW